MRPLRDNQAACVCVHTKPPAAQHSLVVHTRQLWNDWEIQCLVLVSFSLQVFLLFSAVCRTRRRSATLNALLWLAYLSADSVAVFVLGRLTFLVAADDPRRQLVVLFWAPFLLLYLGGVDTVTAFSMEDCALWKRHLLTLTTQVSLAMYVVGKQWRGNKQLVAPTALMFVAGTVSYSERIWALRRASSTLPAEGPSMETYAPTADAYFYTNSRAYYGNLGSIISGNQERNFERVMELITKGFKLCLDFMMDAMTPPRPILRYNRGKELLRLLRNRSSDKDDDDLCAMAYKLADIHLSLIYDYLYTKFGGGLMGVLCHLATLALTCIALALFAVSRLHRKKGSVSYNDRADVIISYILLVGAITLELSSLLLWLMSSYSPWIFLRCRALPPAGSTSSRVLYNNIIKHVLRPERSRVEWSGELQQYNMIDWCIQERQAGWLQRMMRLVGIQQSCTTKPVKLSAEVKKLLLDKILEMLAISTSPEELDLTRFHGQWAQLWVEARYAESSYHEPDNNSDNNKNNNNKQATAAAPSETASATTADQHKQKAAAPSETASTKTADQHKQKAAAPPETASTTTADQHKQKAAPPPETASTTTTDQHKQKAAAQQALGISQIEELGFVTSAFLWHLVTDICVCREADQAGDDDESTSSDHRHQMKIIKSWSRELSNYVMYLVVSCKAILGGGYERDSLNFSRQQMMRFLTMHDQLDRREFVQNLGNIRHRVDEQHDVFHRAIGVSSELLKMEAAGGGGGGGGWDLILTVWVEMLCYIARNCGGGFHAKQLCAGGELVTHVRMLLFVLSFPF